MRRHHASIRRASSREDKVKKTVAEQRRASFMERGSEITSEKDLPAYRIMGWGKAQCAGAKSQNLP